MHDKYDYESSQMAFLNSELKRLMAFGVAGFSVAADSLSAIKYAKVYPIRDENGVIVDYRTEGDSETTMTELTTSQLRFPREPLKN